MLDYGVENKDIDVEYMKEIQNDNFNNYAFDILPHLFPIIKNKLQEKFKLYNEKLDSLNIKRQECYNRNNMNDGKFVDDHIVNSLLEKIVFDKKKTNRLIFDGYPRTLNQAKNLENLLDKSNQKIDFIFFLNVNKETIIKRIEQRKILEKRSDDD